MKILFQSFASGSSGNCYYLGTESEGILIDAGVGVRTLKKHLKELSLTMEQIRAVLITHDHADHIKAVATLAGKYNIPVFSTAETYRGINNNRCLKEKLNPTQARLFQKEQLFRIQDIRNGKVCSGVRQASLFSDPVDEFLITAFEVPHDATDSVGFKIETPCGTFCFLTDMGHITPTAEAYISEANYLIIEANYDEEMLQMGAYPYYLKQRIQSPTGHMSNSDTAEFLASHLMPHLKQVWLCHLSKDNNHPELAYKTFEASFREKGFVLGKDIQLSVLKRTTPSDLFVVTGF